MVIIYYLVPGGPLVSSLDRQVKHYQSTAMAPGSTKNLLSQIRTYLLFCLHTKIGYLPIAPIDLNRYVAFLSRTVKSWNSVINYLNGVRFYHLSHGLDFHQNQNFHVQLTLRGIRKRLCAPVSQKLPITIDILNRIYAILDPHNQTHTVLWASFLIAFFGFLRKSNLIPPNTSTFHPSKHISRGSFSHQPDGTLVLHLTWSKTVQFQQRVISIPYSPIPNSPLCPVSAYTRMISLFPAPPSSPAFIVPFGSSLITLTHSSFTSYLHYFLRRVGLDSSKFSGHSFRRGGCSFAASVNIPPHLLKIHGDWQSSAFERYMVLPLTQRQQVTHKMAAAISS